MMLKEILLVLVLLPLFGASSDFFEAKVAKVIDGDTLIVSTHKDKNITCRIYGIDAPEIAKGKNRGQPYAEEAKNTLEKLVKNTTLYVKLTGQKSYNREICLLKTENYSDIGYSMVRKGYAWAYVEYLKRPHASKYIEAEKQARQEKLGLWKDLNPMPPWEFRKMQKTKN